MSAVPEPRVSVLLDADWASGSLREDVRRGLGTQPRCLPPKWLYDDVGARLFDEITRLPDYYPTEAERSILAARSSEIVAACDATTFVELGSGTSDKTRLLLDAFDEADRLRHLVLVDVAEATLREAAADLGHRYPRSQVDAVVGDFTLHLGHLRQLPGQGSRVVGFLGSTIGNLYLEERAAFLGALADSLDPGDWLLLGTDLVKPVDRIVAAYNDPEGLTAAFVRNSLRMLNRELGADFDPDAFSYVPFWDARMERMDLRLRAEMPQHVSIPGAGVELDLTSGEEIRVEISTKFRLPAVAEDLAAAGFVVTDTWTDPAQDYALTLSRLEP